MVCLPQTCMCRISCILSSTSATVRVLYAYVHRNDESEVTSETFYTRQLTYPMTVTVYHMLECHDMSVMPLDAFSDISDDSLRWNGDPHGWCLFSIEVRNTYGLPFEVTFDRTQQGELALPAPGSPLIKTDALDAAARSVVPPGSTSRQVNHRFLPYSWADRLPLQTEYSSRSKGSGYPMLLSHVRYLPYQTANLLSPNLV